MPTYTHTTQPISMNSTPVAVKSVRNSLHRPKIDIINLSTPASPPSQPSPLRASTTASNLAVPTATMPRSQVMSILRRAPAKVILPAK